MIFSVWYNPHIKFCQHLWEWSHPPCSWAGSLLLFSYRKCRRKRMWVRVHHCRHVCFFHYWSYICQWISCGYTGMNFIYLLHNGCAKEFEIVSWNGYMLLLWSNGCAGFQVCTASQSICCHTLVSEFGNRFYTLDLVTKVIQEMACRVVAEFGIKSGICTGFELFSCCCSRHSRVFAEWVQLYFFCLFEVIKCERSVLDVQAWFDRFDTFSFWYDSLSTCSVSVLKLSFQTLLTD